MQTTNIDKLFYTIRLSLTLNNDSSTNNINFDSVPESMHVQCEQYQRHELRAASTPFVMPWRVTIRLIPFKLRYSQ